MLNLLFWRSAQPAAAPLTYRTLAQAPNGKKVTIKGFGKLSAAHQQHLQAYGMLPGRAVQVLAQKPVTIVLIEQTELAFESAISAQVLVE